MKLIPIREEEFFNIYDEMSKNFIADEIRSFDDAYICLEIESFNIYHVVVEETYVGFISVWDLGTCFYIEHFVIYEEYRNSGLWAKALEIINNKLKNVILEADLPNTNIAKRRLGFYQRNGYKINDVDYVQPAYSKDKNPVPMHLLSYPEKLNNPIEIIQQLHKKVYGVK